MPCCDEGESYTAEGVGPAHLRFVLTSAELATYSDAANVKTAHSCIVTARAKVHPTTATVAYAQQSTGLAGAVRTLAQRQRSFLTVDSVLASLMSFTVHVAPECGSSTGESAILQATKRCSRRTHQHCTAASADDHN